MLLPQVIQPDGVD